MEFGQDGCDRSEWLKETEQPLKQIHIVDTMPDFHYDASLKSMYMDVVRPTEDHRLHRSSKTGLLLRDNETISGPCSLSTKGIDGAQVPPIYKFTNRGAHGFPYLPKTWEDLPRSTPKTHIPEHVKRPSTILDSRDITGTAPNPKNMKIGDDARNTDPLDPHYILPSYIEPFIPLPKFIKNSLDVADIEGTRPSSRQRKFLTGSGGRSSLHATDIEGAQPGWKPLHRRQNGKAVRSLSLESEDINGPVEVRVVRPHTSQVYEDIEGSHSKELSVRRRPGTPHTLSLRSDDIEGANAGSGSWEGTIRRKKEFAKSHSRIIKEQKDAEEAAFDILTTRVQEQLKRKGLEPRDVAATFHQLDRQNSGKLDMTEVTRAFETLRLDVNPNDLSSISKAFVDPTGDGTLDYWNLVKCLVPVYPQQRGLQRDFSDIVAKSMDQGVKSSAFEKVCYDPAWVDELVANRESRLQDGDLGTKFQPFHCGRPVTYVPSKYLKDPPSKFAMQGESYRQEPIQTSKFTNQNKTQLAHEHHESASPQEQKLETRKDQTQGVTREVPMLSVLPEPVPLQTSVNRDTYFQEITKGEPKYVRGREETMFSELKGVEFPPEGNCNANSVPIFYKLKGMNTYETKPLPFGGPFWPGFVDCQPEDLAPPKPKTSRKPGPLPMGEAFWSGIERPQSAPRISLRKDYPVPPLFSEINSEINLRKTGQKEKVLRTWVDTLGHGASATTFVGVEDQVLARPGMKGSTFSRPSSAIQYSCPSRPTTVNSVARGSPAENILSNSCERKLVSAMKRPSTAQSVASTVRSGVTFSDFPSRPSTPYYPMCPSRSTCIAQADQTVSGRIRAQSHHSQRTEREGRKSTPVSTQRQQAQLLEDMNSVRLLI